MYIEMGALRYLVMLKAAPSSTIYYPNGCVKIVYFQKVIVDHKYLRERVAGPSCLQTHRT